MEMWPDSIYSVVPVTQKEKPSRREQTGAHVDVCEIVIVCVYVWLMVLLRFKLSGLSRERLVDASSHNGLLCETGWWRDRKEREKLRGQRHMFNSSLY